MALPKSSTLQIPHRGGYALGGFHDMHGNLVRHQFGSRGEYPRSTDGGNDLSPVVANGGSDAVDAFFGFFIVVSPAPLSASMDIFDEGFDGGVGVGAEAFELNTREKSADLLVVHVQQEGLAEGSTVQGFLLADDFVFAEAGVLILLVDVDHHGALAPREKDDGVQGCGELAHEGCRFGFELEIVQVMAGKLDEAGAETVTVCIFGFAHKGMLDEDGEQAEGSAARQFHQFCDAGQAEAIGLAREDFEDTEGAESVRALSLLHCL